MHFHLLFFFKLCYWLLDIISFSYDSWKYNVFRNPETVEIVLKRQKYLLQWYCIIKCYEYMKKKSSFYNNSNWPKRKNTLCCFSFWCLSNSSTAYAVIEYYVIGMSYLISHFNLLFVCVTQSAFYVKVLYSTNSLTLCY